MHSDGLWESSSEGDTRHYHTPRKSQQLLRQRACSAKGECGCGSAAVASHEACGYLQERNEQDHLDAESIAQIEL